MQIFSKKCRKFRKLLKKWKLFSEFRAVIEAVPYNLNLILFYVKMKNIQKNEKNLRKVLTLLYFCDKIENVKVIFIIFENNFHSSGENVVKYKNKWK